MPPREDALTFHFRNPGFLNPGYLTPCSLITVVSGNRFEFSEKLQVPNVFSRGWL